MTTTMAAASMAATMSVWPAVVAVIGTLAGTLVANVVQAWTARTARRETRRNDAVTAVAALAAALADHRRAMWVLENRQLTGADQDAVAEAQAANHETRSALTAPLVLVKILTPSLARAGPDRDAGDLRHAWRCRQRGAGAVARGRAQRV